MALANFGAKGSLLQLVDLARAEALLRLDRTAEAQALLTAVEPQMREYGRQSAEHGALLLVQAQLARKKGDAATAALMLRGAEAIFRSLGPAGAGYLQNVAALKRETG